MNTSSLYTSLIGLDPAVVLPHGPSKIFLDEFIWHTPGLGVVAAYTPKERDTNDHFGVYRGADQIETFGQATVVAANAFEVCSNKQITFDQLYQQYNFVFLRIGSVICHSFINTGEKVIVIGKINEYKFRQMTASGRMYKVPSDLDLQAYFASLDKDQILQYQLDPAFLLVTEFEGLIGRGIKVERINAHNNL
ncbi:MAG TPA: hypothetical protein PKD18_09920 [Saprospiraceae bacterium]|nr:hypothetical protein [Saprospiraceae bacterium]